jgi:hypothetical protein
MTKIQGLLILILLSSTIETGALYRLKGKLATGCNISPPPLSPPLSPPDSPPPLSSLYLLPFLNFFLLSLPLRQYLATRYNVKTFCEIQLSFKNISSLCGFELYLYVQSF